MRDIEAEKRRRFQFGLRKALLWTAAVALGLGVLTVLDCDAVSRVVYPGWLAAVLILRWRFGSKVAASISVAAGILLFAALCGSSWAVSSSRPEHGEVAMITVVGGFLGGFVGFVLFLWAEAACRMVDWIDRIGQSDG